MILGVLALIAAGLVCVSVGLFWKYGYGWKFGLAAFFTVVAWGYIGMVGVVGCFPIWWHRCLCDENSQSEYRQDFQHKYHVFQQYTLTNSGAQAVLLGGFVVFLEHDGGKAGFHNWLSGLGVQQATSYPAELVNISEPGFMRLALVLRGLKLRAGLSPAKAAGLAIKRIGLLSILRHSVASVV